MKWDSNLYDQEHRFVFQYGADVLDLLDPQPGERILDLGCGTGHLTEQISGRGSRVTGVDSSPEMIAKAVADYPQIDFSVIAASALPYRNEFDAVFANAVLHWISDQPAALASIFSSLKPGGRFVAEMGAQGNILLLRNAVTATLKKHGYESQAAQNPWFFPSAAEYATLLEAAGFIVNFVACFDRPTLLRHEAEGVKNWIRQFGPFWLEGIDGAHQDLLLEETISCLKSTYERGDGWYADYRRLRFIATKPVNEIR